MYVTYHHCLYQQELQPALSLYNCCAIYERPTFWSEPTHLTQTQGADMHCVDSRDGMSTSFLVCPSVIQCAEPNLGQDGRKALALALARALAESTRMQPLNDILRARQQSEPKCRATESVSRDPEARPKTSTSHTTDRILKLHKCQDARRANHGGLTQFARFSRRGLWSQCRSLLLRTVLAVSQCECDLGRRRWRACSFPSLIGLVTDSIAPGTCVPGSMVPG